MSTIRLLDCGGLPVGRVRQVVPSYMPGCYVAAYDPDRGLASLVCTMDPAHALDLPWAAAVNLWRSRDPHVPTRPDGMPNRPLTAFTVQIDRNRLDSWTSPDA